MKEKEAKIDYPSHQMVLYVEKEDGAYGSIQTGSYMAKNYYDDFITKRSELIARMHEKLIENQITSIAFYATLLEMSVRDLAVRVGLRSWQVRRHMKPKYFGSIRIETARRYAEVFGVSLADLFQVDLTVDFLLSGSLEHFPTQNKYATIVRVKKGQQ